MKIANEVLNMLEVFDRALSNEIGDLISAHLYGASGTDARFIARKIEDSVGKVFYTPSGKAAESKVVAIKLIAIGELILDSLGLAYTKEDISKPIYKAMINRLVGNGKDKSTCPYCGFNMPVYPGRYPVNCPQCNQQIGTDKIESINEEAPSASAPPKWIIGNSQLEAEWRDVISKHGDAIKSSWPTAIAIFKNHCKKKGIIIGEDCSSASDLGAMPMGGSQVKKKEKEKEIVAAENITNYFKKG